MIAVHGCASALSDRIRVFGWLVHSWRTAVIAYFIALAEGADPERAATIGVFHDLAETRTGGHRIRRQALPDSRA
jgi:5'-deoxynucleotidase YfbR-like HD superfamily hydrolase